LHISATGSGRLPETRRASLFISQLVGRPVSGAAGERLGSLRDVVVGLEEAGHPLVRGIVVRAEKRDRFVAMRDVTSLDASSAQLRLTALPAGEFERRAGEVLLENDILDRQLVDLNGVRVVRVNDAELQVVDGVWRLTGIDISAKGMLRRLGPRRFVGGLGAEIVDWAVLEPLATQVPQVTLNIPHDQLAKLHPSDIARIVDSLAYPQGAELMRSLDTATAADTMEEIEAHHQLDILEALPAERAADILGEMAPDAAADLLDDMPRAQADDLIARMDAEESADVKLLLSYSEHSAGGIMTTDFVIALEHETTRQAIEYIRGQLDKPDLIYYVYVVDDPDNQRLAGVVSLRDLLLAEPDQALRDYMRRDLRTVQPEASATEVARIMTEYNLLALPVTDATGRMLGLVTADDALEILLPESLKRHVPRLFS
jgi:CBS domain-containing protein/sporulation protein YlmC with PRC-barrel domain